MALVTAVTAARGAPRSNHKHLFFAHVCRHAARVTAPTPQEVALRKRLRILLLPVRVAVLVWVACLPAGGVEAAWNHEGLHLFMMGIMVMVVAERLGLALDLSTPSRDQASKRFLLLGTWAGLLVAVHESSLGTPWLPVLQEPYVHAAGYLLWGAGLALRQWAMRALGKFFTDQVRILNDHSLVTTGPYHWVRHPSYLGLALVMLGAPLSLGSVAGVVVAAVVGGGALAFRIHVEERVLRAKFGTQFDRYCVARPRLIPTPWRQS